MDIIKLTRQLGAAIQQDPAYIAYQLAKENNDKDDNLQKMIGEFNLLRMTLSNELGKADEEKDQQKIDEWNATLQQTYNDVMLNENMMQFNKVKTQLDEMVNQINAILALCINGEDPETCQPAASDCSGGCSSCSGCH